MLNINKKFDQIRANKAGDVIVLDGGLATQLESVHNANIKHNRNKNVGNLWSGNVLLDSLPDPGGRRHSVYDAPLTLPDVSDKLLSSPANIEESWLISLILSPPDQVPALSLGQNVVQDEG